MINSTNPVNWQCKVNAGLVSWWINPTFGPNSRFSEIARGQRQSFDNALFTTPWQPASKENPGPCQSGLILNGSTQYEFAESPPEVAPAGTSFSAWGTGRWSGANQFNSVCGMRRGDATGGAAPLYLQHRQTTGMAVTINSNTNEIVITLGNTTTAGIFSLGISYDATNGLVTGYCNGPAATRTTGTNTLPGTRRAFGNIILGGAEFNGNIGDLGVTLVSNVRVWNRVLTIEEFDFIHSDERAGYEQTLARTSRQILSYIVPDVAGFVAKRVGSRASRVGMAGGLVG